MRQLFESIVRRVRAVLETARDPFAAVATPDAPRSLAELRQRGGRHA